MDFYMVNPSKLRKKKSKKSKSRRRNPELLIVNPYSLNEEGEKQKKRAKMAKRKKKSKAKKSRRRKNPLARRRRRRNPDLGAVKDRFLGPDLENLKTAAVMALGGGLALGVGTAAFGTRLGAGNIGKGLVAVLSGVVGGLAIDFLGKTLGGDLGGTLQSMAVPGAMGAMVLGAWTIAQPIVEPIADNLNAKLGFAGLDAWTKEFEDRGLSGFGAVVEEFSGKPVAHPGRGKGLDEWGNVIETQSWVSDPSKNPFQGYNGYEPLGDIYNDQRIGSFEAEPGFGVHEKEVANARDQQVADEMKHAAGHYGGYEFSLGEGDFGPYAANIDSGAMWDR
jgi:hypothetical protein